MMRLQSILHQFWSKLTRREVADRSLDDELRAYVDLVAAEHERAGMTPAEARRVALVETGGIEQIKEATRDEWAGASFESVKRELRYAVRALRRAPTFVAIAIASLAIGIGGATAVFTVIKASLLRPLPAAAEPHRLITIESVGKTGAEGELSFPDYRDIAAQTTSLAGLAGFNGTSMAVDDGKTEARQWVSLVTDDFFDVLGVRPFTGRFWAGSLTGDTRANDPVVVLGYALWQKRFAGATSVLGSRIKLDGTLFTVIGVAPPRFIGGMTTHRMEMFVQVAPGGVTSPLLRGIDVPSRRERWLRVVARLGPAISIDDAQRELSEIAARLSAAYPETNTGRSFRVLPRTGMTAEERADMSRVPRLLLIAVIVLLFTACGNVASLFLVRSTARRRELATRVALGASRGALVRQVVFEGMLIAIGAGALGILIANLLVRSATLVGTVVSMPDLDLTMDGRVLALAIIASSATALLVSAMPAVQMFGVLPGDVLKDGGGTVRRSLRGQRSLVIAQVSASLMLLSAAAVIYGAFQRVLGAHAGFDPRAVSDATIDVERAIDDTTAQIAFYRELLARAAQDPAIEAAALTTTTPPFQWSGTLLVFRRGEAPPPGSTADQRAAVGVRVNAITISEDFFRAMRIPLVTGRTFASHDTRTSEFGAIVSRRLAGVLWPGQNPIGQVLTWPPIEGPARPPLTIIGVAEDTRDPSLSGPPPLAMYLSFAQRPYPRMSLLLRGRGSTAMTVPGIRQLVTSINPLVTVLGGQTLNHRLQEHVRPQRTASAWVGVFAGIALLLAAIGLYGVVAQGVLQRTKELAVRSALGATPGGLLASVLGDGMRVAVAGMLVGGVASVVALRILRSLFAGIVMSDPRPGILAGVVLTIAMFCAAYLPARRASRLSPAAVLRSD